MDYTPYTRDCSQTADRHEPATPCTSHSCRARPSDTAVSAAPDASASRAPAPGFAATPAAAGIAGTPASSCALCPAYAPSAAGVGVLPLPPGGAASRGALRAARPRRRGRP